MQRFLLCSHCTAVVACAATPANQGCATARRAKTKTAERFIIVSARLSLPPFAFPFARAAIDRDRSINSCPFRDSTLAVNSDCVRQSEVSLFSLGAGSVALSRQREAGGAGGKRREWTGRRRRRRHEPETRRPPHKPALPGPGPVRGPGAVEAGLHVPKVSRHRD